MKRCLCLGACIIDQWEQNTDFDLDGVAANQAILLRKQGIQTALCALSS